VIGVVLGAELLDLRVDLDRVDVLCSRGEGGRDVVAVPGADHEHVARR
jgi:hypothetical protein